MPQQEFTLGAEQFRQPIPCAGFGDAQTPLQQVKSLTGFATLAASLRGGAEVLLQAHSRAGRRHGCNSFAHLKDALVCPSLFGECPPELVPALGGHMLQSEFL